MSVLVT